MAEVAFEQVGKTYDDGTHAVREMTLKIEDGEFMVLVGPSGCGKTTALRLIAGLEDVSAGVIRIGERVVNALEPRARDVAMVFQNYALYPHMTVRDNIAFGLRMRGVTKQERVRRASEIAGVLGLGGVLDRRPNQLSGGQRQRVAMGRAIVREPAVFLMDEPLSNLDARLRVEMRAEVARIQAALGTTTIYVTHDQVEAMTMGSRVCVMRDGVIQQVDTPESLYGTPKNMFVASFIGSPEMNFLDSSIVRSVDGPRVHVAGQDLPCPQALARLEDGVAKVVTGVRPEHLRSVAGEGEPHLRGKVVTTELLGSEMLLHLMLDPDRPLAGHTTARAPSDSLALAGIRNGATGEGEVVARVEAKLGARVGDVIAVRLDPQTLHFFDGETGSAI